MNKHAIKYLEHLYEEIEAYCGITKEQIQSSARHKDIAQARHVLIHLMRKRTDISLQELIDLLGRSDHTTAMHSQKVVRNAIDTNYRPIVDMITHLERNKVIEKNDVKREVAQDIYMEIMPIFAKYGIKYGS